MRKSLLFLACLFMTIGIALAQQRVVKGIVISRTDKQPVIGATVVVKGNTKVGAATDYDGRFEFKVPADTKKLVVSYVGYRKREVAIKDGELKIYLEQDTQILDEVVAVGYSKATRRSFTGSAVTVKAAELAKKSVSNVTQALAGEVPGVNVMNSSGQPGTTAGILVRGIGSVNASTGPLYVVDGMPFMGDISTINPADIESTTLLKDAAATSIYGARGANGVIVITTKNGASGKFTVNASFKQGYNTHKFIPRHNTITCPEEYMELGYSGLMTSYRDIILPKEPGYKGKKFEEYDELARNLAAQYIVGGDGIAPRYNMWNIPQGKTMIDPKTGKFAEGVERIYTPERWADEAFQTSLRTEGTVQISGGTSKLRAFMSLGYLSDKGIMKNSQFDRLTGRVNVNFNPFKWLSTSASIAYANSRSIKAAQSEFTSTNLFSYIDNMPSIYPVYLREVVIGKVQGPQGQMVDAIVGTTGKKIKDTFYDYNDWQYDYGDGRGYAGGGSNGIAEAVYAPDFFNNHNIDFSTKATIRLMKGLSFENTLSGSFAYTQGEGTASPFYGSTAPTGGELWQKNSNAFSYNVLSLLRYATQIDEHNIEAFVAHEATDYEDYFAFVSKKNLMDPEVADLNNATQSNGLPSGERVSYALEGYFGQLNYNYANKYFASASIRRDGSSRFLNNKWGTFGSGSLAWVVSAEDFLKDNKIVNYLKLKASYGTLGQQGGIGLYTGWNNYQVNPIGDGWSIAFNKKGSPDLTWERSTMAQVGFETTLFNMIDLNVEVYRKLTSSLLYDRRVAPSMGYATYKVNDGLMQNDGIDVDLTLRLVKTRDAFFNIRMNAGFWDNKVLEMPIDPATREEMYFQEEDGFGRQGGRSLYERYMKTFIGVNPENGRSLWQGYFYDHDGDGKYTHPEDTVTEFEKGDRIVSSMEVFKHDYPKLVSKLVGIETENYDSAVMDYVGKSALPWVRGGFTFSGGYKNFDISMQFVYSLGGYGYDNIYANLMQDTKVGNNNWHKDMHKAWKNPGDITDVPRLANGADDTASYSSTRFLISNSFLQLGNVRLGYKLPSSWLDNINIKGADIWVSGDNLLLISARRGYNPTASILGGSNQLRYNPLTTISAGFNLTF